MRDAEVRELHLRPESASYNTFDSLKIAMDDRAGVGVRERIEQAQQQALDLRPVQRAHVVGERRAFEQLHRQERSARHKSALRRLGGLLGYRSVVEHHGDVRVLECGDGTYFVLEAIDEHRLGRTLRRQQLDGDADALGLVPRSPDLAHTAPTDAGLQNEGAKRDLSDGASNPCLQCRDDSGVWVTQPQMATGEGGPHLGPIGPGSA